ncbi:MAG: hypothetical protein QXR30_02530 [Candidatus Woesearchaeota archaeon]
MNNTDDFKQESQNYEYIISYLEKILEEIEEIKSRLDNIENKSHEKLKYPILMQWKENIRKNCKYLENINIEGEAEFFCSKIKEVCNLFNCPLNKVDDNEE